MKHVELIIFDLDGTLVDSRKDIAGAVNYTLKELGLKTKELEEISSYIGFGVEDLLRRSLGANQAFFMDKALSIFTAYYRKHSTDSSKLYPGVKDTLEYFRDKKKSIITNRKKEFAEMTLKALGVNGYFENIMGGDDIGCMKPSSCPLDKLVNEGKLDKDSVIIVGDMDIDIIAGKKAGIATCAVTYGIGKKEDILKAKPDFIIDHLLMLKQVIC